MKEEQENWQRIVRELQEVMTIAAIAEAVGAEPGAVWRWKAGTRRPTGMLAVNLYLLHVKRYPTGYMPSGHSLPVQKA